MTNDPLPHQGLRSSKPAQARLQRDNRGRIIQPQAQGFGNWRQRLAQRRQPNVSAGVPHVEHFPENRHTLLRLNRVHDWAAMEQELCQRLHIKDRQDIKSDSKQGVSPQDQRLLERLLGGRLLVATLEDIVDEHHCIVSLLNGQLVWYVPLLSIVDRELLRPKAQVLISQFGFVLVGVLDDLAVNEAANLIVEATPLETYADVGKFVKGDPWVSGDFRPFQESNEERSRKQAILLPFPLSSCSHAPLPTASAAAQEVWTSKFRRSER